jgi:predicted Fe-Mo cluster-binding NifX family protein
METVVCVPVTESGEVDPRWGKAARVGLARVGAQGEIVDFSVVDVGWDRLHDEGSEGSHHARIARFLQSNGVRVVVAEHLGPPMRHMLERMQVEVHLGARGDARQAVRAALTPGDA